MSPRSLDQNKIAFIVCVNDKAMFDNATAHLAKLRIPDGMAVDVLALTGAASMCDGYERGRLMSDAKYKIYMHQDVFLLREEMLLRLVQQFRRCPSVGLIGLAGCAEMPPGGIWWLAPTTYNHVATFDPARERDGVYTYEKAAPVPEAAVAVVDGLLMATQYDVPWRADIFRGWHFYDVSQCLEYRRAGYKVAVLRQPGAPWVVHVSTAVAGTVPPHYEEQRMVLLREYAAELLSSPRSGAGPRTAPPAP